MDHAKKPSGHNLLTYDLAQGFPVWLSFRIIWRHFQNADSQGPFSLPEDSDSEGLGNLYFLQKPFLWCVHTQGYGIADTHLTQPSHFLNFLSVSLKTLITFYTELLFHSMDRDHFLSTCSSVDVFFHSSAALSNDLWASLCQFLFLLGIYQGVGLLVHMVAASFLCTHLHFRTWPAPHSAHMPACPVMLWACFTLNTLLNPAPVCVCVLSCPVTSSSLWPHGLQGLSQLSMGFSRQGY